jgi:hypothetical protein
MCRHKVVTIIPRESEQTLYSFVKFLSFVTFSGVPASTRVDEVTGEKFFEWKNLFRTKNNGAFVTVFCEGTTAATLSVFEKKIDLYDRLRRMWLFKKHGKANYNDMTTWQKNALLGP